MSSKSSKKDEDFSNSAVKPDPRLTPLLTILALVVTCSICSASKIPDMDWKDLTDKKLTETGQAALKMYGDAWHHAETEHFVHHFYDAKEAETIFVHAEVTYQWVKEMFGAPADEKSGKSHIFVFDDKEIWRSFKERTSEKLPGAEAFTNGSELFIYREPFWLEPQRVLAHEITHLVLARFIDGKVPLFLNEGFAEFMATKAIAMKADGNDFNVRTFRLVPERELIPLDELSDLKTYPPEKTEVFYRQSELLARFLILNYSPQNFYALLRDTAGGSPFGEAVQKIYSMDLETFESKFRHYAMAKNTPAERA